VPQNYNISGNTDVGFVRKENEDFLHIDNSNQVFAVCDGMGGHQAGEVASMTASEMMKIAFSQFRDELLKDDALSLEKSLPSSGDILIKSIRLANRAIYQKALMDTEMHGMGTTVVALALEKDMLSIAHVGDSRAYRIDEKNLTPLTTDHSWVAEIQKRQNLSEEEASSMVGKNIITRALGVREQVEVDYRMIKVKTGEKYLLCSDGLCGFADDEDIFNCLKPTVDNNDKIVNNLISMANDRGGSDNVTIIVLEIVEVEESFEPEVDLITFPLEDDNLLEHEDRWINKFADIMIQQTADDTKTKQTNKYKMIAIFSIFIILAAFIIYISIGN
jgi:protein phosphatase